MLHILPVTLYILIPSSPGLSLFWTSCRQRGFTVSDLSDLMSAHTAQHAGLEKRVGNLAPGLRGDLVIWDPEASFKVRYRAMRMCVVVCLLVAGSSARHSLRPRTIY